MQKAIGMALVIGSLVVGLSAQGKLKPVPAVETDMNEYVIVAFNPATWVVSAKEQASGKAFRFRLPPDVFKGQTFSLQGPIPKAGKPFNVNGPKNVRLKNMVVEQHQPGHRMRDKKRVEKGRISTIPAAPMVVEKLAWEIVEVDPREFIIVARHSRSQRVIRFKVNPECFIGMRFFASAEDLASGATFSMLIPNQEAFQGCCTMLE